MLRQLLSIFILALLLISCRVEKTEKTEIPVTEETPETNSTIPNIPLNKLTGKFEPSKDSTFVVIDKKYADRTGMYLQVEAYEAFKKMHAAASEEGIALMIRSATRNFYRQKAIWEAKWTGRRLVDGGENLAQSTPDPTERALKILRWSSMPGTSRHHWGTDIDLNAFENSYFESGKGKKIYNWLVQHAKSYGFCQPYTPKGPNRPNGYNEEKWHWSYMPIATQYLEAAKRSLSNDDISGFEGSEVAQDIDVKQNYILGVSACK